MKVKTVVYQNRLLVFENQLPLLSTRAAVVWIPGQCCDKYLMKVFKYFANTRTLQSI